MMVEMLRKTEGPPRNYSEAKKHVGCSLFAIQTSIPNSSFDFFFLKVLIRDGFQCIVS